MTNPFYTVGGTLQDYTTARASDVVAELASVEAGFDLVNEALGSNLYEATSASSLTVGTGSKSFVATTGRNFSVGQYVFITRTAAPSTNMIGQVTAYDRTTGAMTVDVLATSGSGTYAGWTIALSQSAGITPVTNGGTGVATLTAGYLLKGNGTSPVTASAIYDNGAGSVGIGTSSLVAGTAMTVNGPTAFITAGASLNIVPDDTSGANGTVISASFAAGGYGPLKLVTSNTERMRIGADGKVGIGTDAPAQTLDVNGNVWLRSTTYLGTGMAQNIAADSTTVYVRGAATAFQNAAATDNWAYLDNTLFRPGHDNTSTLGHSSYRWSTVYAVTGTINTSDERTKRWIGFVPEHIAPAERIAAKIYDEFGFYQFLDAIAEKGEDGPDRARWHFGARAQRVWAIFAEEGFCAPLIGEGETQRPDPDWLGPPPPALLCFDSWDDQYAPEFVQQEVSENVLVRVEDTGLLDKQGNPITRPIYETVTRTEIVETGNQVLVRPAGNRFGFRTDQVALLMGWNLDRRLKALEAAA